MAVSRARDQGIILRSTATLEKMRAIDHIFFDKTGTLTILPMRVNRMLAYSTDENELLRVVASLEQHSSHPLAEALVSLARKRDIDLLEAVEFEQIAGRGAKGMVENQRVWVGNAALLQDLQIEPAPQMKKQANDWRRSGFLYLYVIWDDQIRGLIALGEKERPEARDALAALRDSGYQLEILTGDDSAAGARWQKKLGIPVTSQLLPEEKLDRIKQKEGHSAMVGDGVNDGPALASAELGIALNRGADLARAAADAILLKDNLAAVPWLFDLGREAERRVKQNLLWALTYNVLGVGLAVTGQLQPVWAALAMVASSFLVTRNALKLRRFPLTNPASPPPDPKAKLNPHLEKTYS